MNKWPLIHLEIHPVLRLSYMRCGLKLAECDSPTSLHNVKEEGQTSSKMNSI
jgi:hypothetical protein